MKLNRPEHMLFALLRSAFWRQEVDEAVFSTATAGDWSECMHLAVSQGVQAVAFDGVAALPVSCRPPRTLKLAWAAGTAAIERRHARYLHTLSRLSAFYEKQGLRMMLMKGPGLAADYPVPAHRESGDLDIWLFGEYAEGNRLMEQQGISVDTHGPKHSCFYFEGIPVENHRTFLNVTQFKTDRLLEPVLHRSLADGICGTLSLPERRRVWLPSPLFSAVFLARHMSVHFVNGIVLRHLCDWAHFLCRHQGEYEVEKWMDAFHSVGLLPVVQAFTWLTVEYIGLPPEYAPFPTLSPVGLEELLLADILRPSIPARPENKNPFGIISFKWRRLLATRWKYELVHRESFGKKLTSSAVSHLLHPGTIFNLE